MATYYYKYGDWKRIGTHTVMRMLLYYESPLAVTEDSKTLKFKIGYEIEYDHSIDITPRVKITDTDGRSVETSFNNYDPSSAGTHKVVGNTWRQWKYSKGTSSRTESVTLQVTNSAYTNHPKVTLNITIPALEKFTITYNGNGATSGMPSSTTQYQYYGKTITIASAPQKTGYSFKTWSGSNGKSYSPGSKPTITTNLTLTAQWTINSYTLTYNANGGSVSPTSKSVNYGSPYGTLPTPTRTGYTFQGWFTSNGTQVTSSTTIGAANITIYAHWTINSYSLSFSNVSGVQNIPTGYPKNITYNTTLTDLSTTTKMPINPVGSSTNYYYSYEQFDGWYSGNTKYTASSTMPAFALTLSPHWNTNNSLYPNVTKVTASRASYNSQSQEMYFDDIGNGCVVKIEGKPYQIYRFNKSNTADTGELVEPDYIKIHVDVDGDSQKTYEASVENKFPINVNIYNDVGADINTILNANTAYNINVTVTGLVESSIEVGTSPVKTDLLTKAAFTVDISANGDRIGIFQPINDIADDPNTYKERELELSGAMYVTPLDTINLGSCFVPSVLTNTGGRLYFSIPTGRVFNKNLRVASLSFGIVTRQGSNNDSASDKGGMYITGNPDSSATMYSPAPFNYIYNTPVTGTFAFRNAEQTYTTINYSDMDISIQGNTSIRILMNTTNTTKVFTGNLYTYLNNQPGVIELSNIQLTLAPNN